MNLRLRLIMSAILVAVLSVSATWIVAESQERQVESDLDARLRSLLPVARVAVVRADDRRGTPRILESIVSDAWIGTFEPEDGLSTVVAPIEDPGWTPEFGIDDISTQSVTVGTSAGGNARVMSALLRNNRRIVVALSTEPGERTIAQLRRTSALFALFVIGLLAAMVWWVTSLGISPIARMTTAARRIADGEIDLAVPVGPGNSEASQLGEALNTMILSLRASDERIRQFIADASHELRTPLTTLRGYSDLYESGALRDNEMVADAMRRIRSESDRMARIIDDLIQLRGMDRLIPSVAPCRLDLLVAECVSDLLVIHHPRKIGLFAEEVTVSCDRQLVTQAVMALGTNAMEHTPIDTTVTVTVGRVPGAVRISVHDDGPVIPPQHLERLFERLYRVDPSRDASKEHSGIGLAIVAAIAAAHGGSRGVDSSSQGGTTFWFDLPDRESRSTA